MRLLRLDFGDDLHRLDLHPLVTVVDDLSFEQQCQLFTAVRELARGTARSFCGLVEHRGVLTEVQQLGDFEIDERRRSAFDVVLHVDHPDEGHRLIGIEAEIEQCRHQAEIDAVTLEELRADLKPSLFPDVVGLRSRIKPAALSGSSPIEADSALLEAVLAAIDRIDSHSRYEERTSPEVDDLLNRWSAFVETRDHHRQHLHSLEQQMDHARDRVREAEASLTRAEEAARPVVLSMAEEARMEALAEREDSTHGVWWRRNSELSTEERQELDGLLAKVGVGSLTEYFMFRLAPDSDPDLQAAIERARHGLAEAEAELHEIEQAVQTDPVVVELGIEESLLRTEAKAHLGAVVPEDVAAGLRELTERYDHPGWIEAVNQLDRLLHDGGIMTRPAHGDEPDQLVDWARSWVEGVQSTRAPGPLPEPDDIELLRQELDEAERKLVRHHRALTRIQGVQDRLASSRNRLNQLQRLADQLRQVHAITADEVVDSVFPVVEQVRSDLGYAVPIVISGSLPHLSATEITRFMDRLEHLAKRVQVIVLTGRSEPAQWVERSGPTRALHSSGSARSLWSSLP